MRIVVFSDSHNNYFVLKKIVTRQPEAELFLHLGDGEREFALLRDTFPEKFMLGVRGNCDWASAGKVSDLVTVHGRRIFFTHGHAFGVKSGLEALANEAKNLRADIVLYGHTHIAECDYRDGIYFMNPGSVATSQQGAPSYGIADITDAGVFTNVVRL